MEELRERVVGMFRHYGLTENGLLTKERLTDILNRQATINLHRKFSPTIIDEIWGQTETTSRGESTVLTFAKIFSEAMGILRERISIIDGPTGIMQREAQLRVEQGRLAELEAQYQQGYQQAYDKNNVARKNITAIEAKIQELKNNKKDFQRDLQEMEDCLQIGERQPTIERSQYLAQSKLEESISPPAPSPHLSLIFKVTVLAILLQLLFLDFRESFLALLCYSLILYWLFLGYHDQHFVKLIMGGVGLSCVFDIAFACLQLIGKMDAHRQPQRNAWVFISGIFLIVEVALRVLLLIKLCLFREPSAKKEYFELFNHEIQLNARSGKMFSSQRGLD